MNIRSRLLVPILFAGLALLLPDSPRADGMCTERPAHPAESAILEKARKAALAFIPASSPQWTMTEEFIQEVPSEVCREFDHLPIQATSQRRYEKTGREDRDKKSRANMEQAGDRIKQAQEKNKARIEQIDRELEALTKQAEQAAQRQDVATIQRVATRTQALMEEKDRLMQASGTMDDLEKTETKARKDTRLSLEVSFNPVYFSFVHATKTVRLAGADVAVIMIRPEPVTDGENAEMVILLGRWKPNGSDRWDSTFNPATPRTRIQTIGIRILADEQRLMTVAKQLPLGTLHSLIGQ